MERVEPARPRNAAAVGVVTLGVALVAWLITIGRMRGMGMGPGTDLGGLGWYVGVWVTMMAAMMLPSALPMLLLVRRTATEPLSTWFFAAGYLAAWTAYGLAAYAFYRLLAAVAGGVLAWDRAGPYAAGAAVAAAGLYQLTPLKTACLRHCRSPLHFLLHRWRAGAAGAAELGVRHGLYCVGCCAGLMLVLFAVGVMSIFWMVVIAAVVFAEKVLPGGARLLPPLAVALMGLGLWIAVAPGSVPHLMP